jgi:hypothetical protein
VWWFPCYVTAMYVNCWSWHVHGSHSVCLLKPGVTLSLLPAQLHTNMRSMSLSCGAAFQLLSPRAPWSPSCWLVGPTCQDHLPHSVRSRGVQDCSAWPARVAGPSLPCGPSVFEHCWADPMLALFPPYLLSASCAGGWWTDSGDLSRNKMPISPLGLRPLEAGRSAPLRYARDSGILPRAPRSYKIRPWLDESAFPLLRAEHWWEKSGGAARRNWGNPVGASIIACTAEQIGWRTDHHGQSWSNPSRPRSDCAAVEVLWSSMATSREMGCRRRNQSDVAIRGHDLDRDAPLCHMEDVRAPPDRIYGGDGQHFMVVVIAPRRTRCAAWAASLPPSYLVSPTIINSICSVDRVFPFGARNHAPGALGALLTALAAIGIWTPPWLGLEE